MTPTEEAAAEAYEVLGDQAGQFHILTQPCSFTVPPLSLARTVTVIKPCSPGACVEDVVDKLKHLRNILLMSGGPRDLIIYRQ